MEVLGRLLPKLAELLLNEYNLQKEVKDHIQFLQLELEHMKVALEKISGTPVDQLDKQDKIWARDVRELSYDIEDKVDTFLVHCKGNKAGKKHGFKEVIDRTLHLLIQSKIRRKIATDIRDIKSRVTQVPERRDRYKVNTNDVPKPALIDPRILAPYDKVVDFVGIDEARDQVIKTVSIVGFGGIGKTTLANAVYENMRARFDCTAFASVSQTPNMVQLFKGMLHQLNKEKYKNINGETWNEGQLIGELRQQLLDNRYLIVIDDVWDIEILKTIRCALPDDNAGGKIITTTRILSIAEQAGFVYKMEPLSLENSEKLFYMRIFGNENKDSNEDLAEVSDKILKKCAGVPLAVITIASLLASKGRNKMKWYEVYNSIGTGLENSLDMKNMRKILSFSYYDMPSHLRTCLLYLSAFPEDCEIEKIRLIRLWRAEGFIQCGEHGKNGFELGESYFNELINRNMIQPVEDAIGVIRHCRVHDVVLDLIRSLSREENMITLLCDMVHTSVVTTVRRLSLQNGTEDHVSTQVTMSMPQVRSVFVFSSTISQVQVLQSFKVLRVLDLQGCNLSQEGYKLKDVGRLFHLRYLNLNCTRINQLPKEVGNLQFLETLDVTGNKIPELPETVAQLKYLICLSVDSMTRVPRRIGGLMYLEELSHLRIDEESVQTIEELGLLAELKVLHIVMYTNKWDNKLVESLSKLTKIQSLVIDYSSERCDSKNMDALVPPQQIRSFDLRRCWFSVLPSWMNPSHLLDLSILQITVRELQQEDLNILGRLPALRCLELELQSQKLPQEDLGTFKSFVVGSDSFPCLGFCNFRGFVVPMVFQKGAMPKLTKLQFSFHVLGVRQIADANGRFDLGLGNLPSLRSVEVAPYTVVDKDNEEALAVLKQAIGIHPNCPTHNIWPHEWY